MSEFDDPTLKNQLGTLSGPFPDDNVAFAQFQSRASAATRRRRAIVMGAGACACLLVIGGFLVGSRPGGPSLGPADRSDAPETGLVTTISVAPSSSSSPTSTSPNQSTTSSMADQTEAVTTMNPGQSPPNQQPSQPPAPNTDLPDTDEPPDSSVPDSDDDSQAPSVTQRFAGVGGSITVRQTGNSLTLIGIDLAQGFEDDTVDDGWDRIEVRLISDTHETRIRVDLVNGHMQVRVDEQDIEGGGSGGDDGVDSGDGDSGHGDGDAFNG